MILKARDKEKGCSKQRKKEKEQEESVPTEEVQAIKEKACLHNWPKALLSPIPKDPL